MSPTRTDPRVDDYIRTLPEWQQVICQRVRKMVLAADAEITETIKRANRPYYTLQGDICALLGAKDHVNIFLYDPVAPDPEHIINQGTSNVTARAIQIYQNDILNDQAFIHLVKAIVANNRAGGWRKAQV